MKKQVSTFFAGIIGAALFCAIFSIQWIILGTRPIPTNYTLPFLLGCLNGIIIFRLKKRWETEASHRENDQRKTVQEIAGAMCHEMSQPLQALLGNVNILKLELKGASQSILDHMERDIFRIKGITHRLDQLQQYKTKPYLSGRILDIDQSSLSGDANEN